MKKLTVTILHLFLWVLIFFTFFNILNVLSGLYKNPGYNPYTDNALYIRAVVTTIMLSIPFYLGYILTPYLFNRQKKKLFVGLAVLFGVLFPIAMSIMDDGFRPGTIMQSVFLFAFLNMFLILGLSFRSLFGWIEQKQRNDFLEKQNLKSELALLRTQLNPHFLFNTLHNIDTLIKDDQIKASKSLIKLSDIMRYMLSDSRIELVSVEKEMEYINNYISLEKLRLKNEGFLSFNISGDCSGVEIAPMLFVPFIENAFKHSVDSEIENGITIDFTFRDNTITFICENQYDNLESEKDKTHGIGLEIVEKRLELLYPDKHKLSIEKINSNYKVILEISINEDELYCY